MDFSVAESEIFHPPRTGLVSLVTVTRKRVEVVEQNDGDATDRAGVSMRQVGERVGGQGPRCRRLRCGGRGFRSKNADGLRLAAIKDGEVLLRQAANRAVVIA